MAAPPRPSGGAVRRLRRKLWHDQKRRCHWCAAATILPEDLLREYVPLDDLYSKGYAEQLSDLHQQLMRDRGFRRRWLTELATLDHLVEHAAGGPFDETNLVVACSPCNHGRGEVFNRTFDLEQLAE